MTIACARTITLLYIYLCVWGLDLRLNNVNYSYWYFPSSTIITSLYWTSKIPLSSSITTSEYLICDTLKTCVIGIGAISRPFVCLILSCHTEIKFFLLSYLIWQLKRNIFDVDVLIINVHAINLPDFFVIWFKRFHREYSSVPRNAWIE